MFRSFPLCVATARADWDDVVEFEQFARTALHATTLVALPHKQPDRIGNGIPAGVIKSFQIFQRGDLSANPLVLSLLAKDVMLEEQHISRAVALDEFRRLDSQNAAEVRPPSLEKRLRFASLSSE